MRPSVHPSIQPSSHQSINPSIHPFIHPSIHPSILPVHLIRLSHLSIYLISWKLILFHSIYESMYHLVYIIDTLIPLWTLLSMARVYIPFLPQASPASASHCAANSGCARGGRTHGPLQCPRRQPSAESLAQKGCCCFGMTPLTRCVYVYCTCTKPNYK